MESIREAISFLKENMIGTDDEEYDQSDHPEYPSSKHHHESTPTDYVIPKADISVLMEELMRSSAAVTSMFSTMATNSRTHKVQNQGDYKRLED